LPCLSSNGLHSVLAISASRPSLIRARNSLGFTETGERYMFNATRGSAATNGDPGMPTDRFSARARPGDNPASSLPSIVPFRPRDTASRLVLDFVPVPSFAAAASFSRSSRASLKKRRKKDTYNLY
jgi:hypothetical protein